MRGVCLNSTDIDILRGYFYRNVLCSRTYNVEKTHSKIEEGFVANL